MQYIWTIKLNSRHFVQKVDSDGSILVKDKIRSVTERATKFSIKFIY